jgi:drug/metabolite transporter (DMT)-like permease
LLYIIIFTTVVISAFSSVIYNRASKSGLKSECLNIITNVPTGLILFLYSIFFLPLSGISSSDWGLLLLIGLLWSVSCWSAFQAIRFVDASSIKVFSALQFIIVIFGGYICFDESMNSLRIIGCALVILAILMLSSGKVISSRKGLSLCLICSIFSGIAMLLEKYAAQNLPVAATVVAGFLFPGVVQFLLFKNRFDIESYSNVIKYGFGIIPILAVLAICAHYLKIYILAQNAEIIIISLIMRLDIILVLLIEIILLSSIQNFKKRLISGLLATAGVILATLF